jgi:tRNA-specific 2-thiouridylase
MRPATVVDRSGATVGRVDAIELVTLGQRKGLGLAGGGPIQYAVDIDVARAVVTVGGEDELLTDRVELDAFAWTAGEVGGDLEAQCSAHGPPRPCRVEGTTVVFAQPQRRVASGQSVVVYAADTVVAAGIAR